MFLIEQQVSPYADLIKQSTKTKTLTMQWLMIFTCWSGHMCLFRISEKLKNNGHLAAGRQSREVPLHLKKLCKLRPKKKKTWCVKENKRQNCRRIADVLLLTDSCRTPGLKTSLQNAAVIMTDAQPSGLLLLLWSHGAFDLLVLWLQGEKGWKSEVSVWSSPLCQQLQVSVFGLVCVQGMTKKKL